MAADRAQLRLPLADAPAAADPGPTAPADLIPALPVPARPSDRDAIRFVRRRGTRRYILRVLDDGSLQVTVPWWGTQREARRFADSQQAWVVAQRARRATSAGARWSPGGVVLVDGEPHALVAETDGRLHLAGTPVAAADAQPRVVRAAVHAWLRRRALTTLPPALLALAATHAISVTRVSIRNQSSRWGSCSRRGGITLNWRLVQAPPWVREYVLLHELMHRRELNHSARFWRHVAAVCPRYVDARRWLRVEGAQLFD